MAIWLVSGLVVVLMEAVGRLAGLPLVWLRLLEGLGFTLIWVMMLRHRREEKV
jgi:hypothetical protein